MKRKKVCNLIITIVSALYLVAFIIVFVSNRITNKSFDFLGTDILTLTGAIFALVEFLFSKRNWISQKVAQVVISNKVICYEISVFIEKTSLTIEEIVDLWERCLKEYFRCADVKREPVSKLQKARYNIFYRKIGIRLECQCNDEFDLYNEGEKSQCEHSYLFRLSGNGKYGRKVTSNKDILFFSTLIKILSNYFFDDVDFMKKANVGKVDICISKDGSQIGTENLFNEDITGVQDYRIKINDDLSGAEIEVTKDRIIMSTLSNKGLFDGAEKLTEIICKIS